MNGSEGRLRPSVAHVRSLDGEFYLCGEVADALSVSPATLRRLVASDQQRLGPSHITRFGAKAISLYDTADITRVADAVRQPGSGARRGRARLWDDDERRARRRVRSAASY